jgi:hypothetical protein
MNRYRLNTKNFSKAKRGIRGGEYYIRKTMFRLYCQIVHCNSLNKKCKTYYEIPKELLNKYKKYLPNYNSIQK